MEQNNELFEKASVPKAVANFAIPAIISMMVVVIYNVADTFFIGQTGNEYQVAAVSLTTPIFMLFMATGTLLGIGGTSVISRALGEGRPEYAKKVSSFCFYLSIAIGCLMMLLFWAGMQHILAWIGTSADTIGYAREFLNWIALGAPFIIVSQALSNIVRAEGKSREAMFGVVLSAVVNIILDPILIFGLDMGVAGAALATVTGSIFGTGYYVIYFLRRKSSLSISPMFFKMDAKLLIAVFSIGIPAFFTDVLMSFSNIVLNNFLVGYGDAQIAAMNVAMKASMIIVLLQIGMGQGIQPLLGYNYGAKNYRRFREIIRFTVTCTIIVGAFLTGICWLNMNVIISAFIDNQDVVSYGVVIMKALLLSGPVMGILFILTNALQAMGKATPSLILSLSRQGLVFVPMLIILNALSGFSGIVYAQPVTDYVSLMIAGVLYYLVIRKYPAGAPAGAAV